VRNVLIWPSNENYGTNCDNLDMLIREIRKIAEVDLDNVDPVGITEVSESHSQPLSSEELYDFAQQLTAQQKENEDGEGHGTKATQTKDLTDILSAINMAAEKLSDIDPEWERSSTVKRGIRAILHLIMQSCTKRRKNQNSCRYVLS